MKELFKVVGISLLIVMAFAVACGLFALVFMGTIYFFGPIGIAYLIGITMFLWVCSSVYVYRNLGP